MADTTYRTLKQLLSRGLDRFSCFFTIQENRRAPEAKKVHKIGLLRFALCPPPLPAGLLDILEPDSYF